MFNAFWQRTGQPCLEGVCNEGNLAMVGRDSTTNNGEIPDVTGYGDCCRGTVSTFHFRHVNIGQWKKDQASIKQYNQLKT